MAITKKTLLKTLSTFLREVDERYFGTDSVATSVTVSKQVPTNPKSHWGRLGDTTEGELFTNLLAVSQSAPTTQNTIWIKLI